MNFLKKKKPAPQVIAMDKLMRFTGEVEDAASDGKITGEQMDDLSADIGVPREKLYAGLGMSGQVQLQTEHEVQFVVCTGGCQTTGALDCLSELLNLREDRIDAGQAAFDVIPKHCLSRCQVGPVVEIRTPDGAAVLSRADAKSVTDAVEQVLE